MVALHTIQQHLQFVAQFGDGYAASIEAAIAKRTDTKVYLRMEHPAFLRWHGGTVIGKPPPLAPPVKRTASPRGRWKMPQPGTLLAKFIRWLGFESNDACGCSSYAAAMDTLGWRECWHRREAIATRLIEQANRHDLQIVGVRELIAATARLSWRRLASRRMMARDG